MTTHPPRRRARALVLIAALSATLLAGAAPVAQADEIPLAIGHRLVDHYEGAPGTARPVPGRGTAQHEVTPQVPTLPFHAARSSR
ncbi:hypothetical protein [Streptomyces zaomyceticus]|uniref:hypothetical protein n=1 Tax=Streptomyces zaomyceticus TaxID=68286 RepID=UPI00343FA70A